jgi:2,4-dienoyl-CoA reductase-like NADH-dependent reductase (Old Yellow Enzyme family)
MARRPREPIYLQLSRRQNNNIMSTPYPALFQPFTLAGRPLKNRIVHASMNTHMADNTKVTQALIQYHVNRARGGAAMLVTEPISLAHHQNVYYRSRGYNDDNLELLKRWAAGVESQDCRLLGQLQDPGRGRHNTGLVADAISASALPDDLSWTMPRALRADELQAMVDDFTQSVQRLQRCGFSGIEISAGHGHLFHQFLSPWMNLREDEYGGDVEGRTRFLRELVSSLRAACGKNFIIGLKLPGDDYAKGGVTPAEAAKIAARVTQSKEVDYVNFVQGTHGLALEWHLPDSHGPRMPYLELFRQLRPHLNGVPLLALGRITEPFEAETILKAGDAELIGLGRGLLADPAWPLKAREGREKEIRQCTWCNLCWDAINTHLAEMKCVNNPSVAQPQETDWWPARAVASKRVVVVGTGVAGLEAAWNAAARGHHVTAFGSSAQAGGKTRWHAQLPGSAPLSSIIEYQLVAAQKAGVKFELGATATAEQILALKPDRIVLATGARMVAPQWLPAAARQSVPDLRSAIAALLRAPKKEKGSAVIFDMDHTEATYASAELLRTLFDRVFIITPRETIAEATAIVTHQGVVRRMREQKIQVVPLAEPRVSADWRGGRIEYADMITGEAGAIEDVAFFAYSTPRTPNDELAMPLRAAGIDVRVIGDCRAPRGLMVATAEGHAAGNAV